MARMRRPVRPIYFIASYPRSGNTWVRAFIYMLMREAGLLKVEDPGLVRLDEFLPWDIDKKFCRAFLGIAPDAVPVPQMAALRQRIHEGIARTFPGPPLVKTHALFGTFLGYPTINTKFCRGGLYLVRNPLDVASSLAKHFSKPLDAAIVQMATRDYVMDSHPGAAAEPWGSWSLNVASWTVEKLMGFMVVRYEDIVASPLQVLSGIARHIGFDVDEAVVERAVERVDLGSLKEMEQKRLFKSLSARSEQFFGGGAGRDFREKLTPAQTRKVLETQAVQMQRFGYLTEATLDYAGTDAPTVLAAASEQAVGDERVAAPMDGSMANRTSG